MLCKQTTTYVLSINLRELPADGFQKQSVAHQLVSRIAFEILYVTFLTYQIHKIFKIYNKSDTFHFYKVAKIYF